MAKAVVVRYQTRADAADRTQHLIEQVFAELNAEDPGGIRYAAFRLADGVSFVHIALTDGHSNPLSSSKAFAAFQNGASERQVAPPVVSEAALVGSYRLAEE
jgi:hypothetical protein